MNDKERFEEIKRRVMTFNPELREIGLEEHIDWLIKKLEQAEEVAQSLNDLAELAEQFLNDKHFYMCELKKVEEQLQQAQKRIRYLENELRGLGYSDTDLDNDFLWEFQDKQVGQEAE